MTATGGTTRHELTRDELIAERRLLKEKIRYLEGVVHSFQTVAEQHQFTQYAIDNMASAAFWMTEEARLVYVNEAACTSLGYSREELMQMTAVEFMPGCAIEEWPGYWQRIRERKHDRLECLHQRRDGSSFPVELVTNYVEFHGCGFLCIFARDISGEHEARQALDAEQHFNNHLIEMAPVMILILNERGQILKCNPHTERVTGHTLAEAEGRGFTELLFAPDIQPTISERLKKAAAGERKKSVTLDIITKTGERRHIVFQERAISPPAGVPSRIIVIGQDVTEDQQLRSRLKQSEKMEAIGQLAGGVAHGFNNQLSAILGYTDILRDETRELPHLYPYVNNIVRAVQRASDLSKQLLAFSRKERLLSAPLDVNQAVLAVVALLEGSFDKRIRIHHSLMPSPAGAIGDMSQLENALLNIALNARDAMPDGGELRFKTLLVSLKSSPTHPYVLDYDPGLYIQVTVSDTGTGIPPDGFPHLFEPFYTTKPKDKGTGLGLSVVFGTIKRHKGTLRITSPPGKGTTVHLYLPYVPLERTQRPTETGRTAMPSPDSIRVLLAEDEPLLRQVATEMLCRLGCTVTACKDGREAVSFYARHAEQLDLVIVDVVMPRMSGKEALLAMKAINPEVRVIAASGYSMDQDVHEILSLGAKAFVAKPFRKRELSKAITEVLGTI